jgi:hypothetical protein
MPIWLAEQACCRLNLQSHAVQDTCVSFVAKPTLLLQPQPFGAKLLQLVSDGVFALFPSIWISVRLQQLSSLKEQLTTLQSNFVMPHTSIPLISRFGIRR